MLAIVQILNAWTLIIGGALCVLFAVIPHQPGHVLRPSDRLLDLSFFAFGVAVMIGGVRLS